MLNGEYGKANQCGIEGCEKEAATYRLWPGANDWGCWVCLQHAPKTVENEATNEEAWRESDLFLGFDE